MLSVLHVDEYQRQSVDPDEIMLRVLHFKLQLRSLDVKIAEPDQNLRRVHAFRQMYISEESAGSTDVVGKHRFGNLKTRNRMI